MGLLKPHSCSPRHGGSIPHAFWVVILKLHTERSLITPKLTTSPLKTSLSEPGTQNCSVPQCNSLPEQLGLIKPFVICPDPLVSPRAPVDAFVRARLQINPKAFGKQQLTGRHSPPITGCTGETRSRGLPPQSEAPAFRFGFTGLGKCLTTTAQNQSCISKQPSPTLGTSSMALGSSSQLSKRRGSSKAQPSPVATSPRSGRALSLGLKQEGSCRE